MFALHRRTVSVAWQLNWSMVAQVDAQAALIEPMLHLGGVPPLSVTSAQQYGEPASHVVGLVHLTLMIVPPSPASLLVGASVPASLPRGRLYGPTVSVALARHDDGEQFCPSMCVSE